MPMNLKGVSTRSNDDFLAISMDDVRAEGFADAKANCYPRIFGRAFMGEHREIYDAYTAGFDDGVRAKNETPAD